MSQILIIEDDPNISEIIKMTLEDDGHECRTAKNGKEGLEAIKRREPDLITLDIMLGDDETGTDICKTIRHEYARRIGILMLTAKSGNYNEAIGVDSGCDVYMEKPFDPELLKIRVRGLARRIKEIRLEAITEAAVVPERQPKKDKIVTSHLTIDLDRRRVWAVNTPNNGTIEAKLTDMEFKVLVCLVEQEGRIVTRKKILQNVWKTSYINDRLVDRQVCSVRKKINDLYGKDMEMILTVQGEGYKFVDDEVS